MGPGTHYERIRNKIEFEQEPKSVHQAPTLEGSGMHFSRIKKSIGGVRDPL